MLAGIAWFIAMIVLAIVIGLLRHWEEYHALKWYDPVIKVCGLYLLGMIFFSLLRLLS